MADEPPVAQMHLQPIDRQAASGDNPHTMLNPIRQFFAVAPSIPRKSPDEVQRLYPRYRIRVMEATFLGYAAFYLVRNNFSVVAKDMKVALGYDNTDIGNILAITAITYGIGKFFMGALSDRSNPRKFMACGLLLTAVCNFGFGGFASYPLHLFLWGLNGLFQGMGWPPCGRSMGHWFSEKERGLTFSIWNTSHNIGGGIAGFIAAYAALHFGGWQWAFYFPGVLALVGSLYLFFRLVDTPQSVGLPPIEEYHGPSHTHCQHCGYDLRGLTQARCPECGRAFDRHPRPVEERELSYRELFIDNVLANRLVWLLALGNFFSYIARYSMLDWGPTYLREVKHATLAGGGWAVLILEFGGIPSTILLGWLSDRLGGRRGMVCVLCLLPIMAAFAAIMFTPPGYLEIDMAMLAAIGFFIYPVINLIVIMALDATGKKAIGTAAGFIGLFGYIGRTVQAKGFGWMLQRFEPMYGKEIAWQIVLGAILACTALAVVFLAFTWNLTPRSSSGGRTEDVDAELSAVGSQLSAGPETAGDRVAP